MSMSAPDFKSLSRNDQIALGAGVLVFVASFLPWYGVKFKGELAAFGAGSATVNAWHGLAAFGLVLLLLGLVVVAAQTFAGANLPELPTSYEVVAAGLSCLGALFVIIKSFDLPSYSGADASVGLRWGGWILLILVVVQAVATVMRVMASGGFAASSGRPSAPVPPAA
ncbi:MAG TPA: DUF5336 domain-containing protein [Mycobacteriales bacterium]|nr:DUF5336 domain-containing protein [Mycobacteriales bacterium]